MSGEKWIRNFNDSLFGRRDVVLLAPFPFGGGIWRNLFGEEGRREGGDKYSVE